MTELRSTINARIVERDVLSAALAAGLAEDGENLQTDFEHGQWWVTNLITGAQWSVCDAEGTEANGVFDGFCFEQVSQGEQL